MEELGARLNQEMKRVQHEIAGAMEGVATELQRVMEEFHREHGRGPNPLKGLHRVDRASARARPISKKKRPRRKPQGSAAAPVEPRPKPKPLKDGAEAPID